MVHHSDDDDDSDENATGSSSDEEEQRRRSTSTSRSKKKDRKRSRSSSKKSDRKKQKKRSKKDKKRRENFSDDNGIDEDAASVSSDSSRDRRKRRKRDKKEKRGGGGKHHRKHRHHRKQSDDEDEQQGSNHNSESLLERNYALADALCHLLEHHPALASDLPILLIRLGGGTTFDFSQMSVPGAAQGLNAVFAALRPFGVVLQQPQEGGSSGSSTWMWKNPAGMASGAGSELTLIRVVRALLDQIGITVPAIEEFENPPKPSAKEKQKQESIVVDDDGNGDHRGNDANGIIEQQATNLLLQFGTSDLAKELAGLCAMILEGESIALDGLPNEQLRKGLEALFESCGLVLSEMEESSDDDDDNQDDGKDNNDSPAKGYGLPESNDRNAKAMLQSILQVCENAVSSPSPVKPVIKGPMLPPKDYQDEAESSDDEGPLPVGASKVVKAVSNEVVKAKAARRARELECAKHGVEFDATVEGNAREEWMLVPGKFDFLSAVKSGQPIRSRQFDGKTRGDAAASKKAVDPKIQAEIRSIRQAHEDLRGPSLMEQHRAMKQQEAEEKQKQGKESWKWNRDKDLDAGRRVDKDALSMILGGAGKDLKSKFH